MDTTTLVTPTIGARFGTRPGVLFTHGAMEASFVLKGQSTIPSADEGVALDSLADRLVDVLPEGWSARKGIAGLRHPPPPEPPGATRASHWFRADALERSLGTITLTGADLIRSLPAGWMTPAEIAISAIADRLGREPAGQFRLRDVKEKFGALRFYYDVKGSDRLLVDLRTIVDWMCLSSEERCMVTGQPGTRDDTLGWVLTLSEEMRALRRAEPERFLRLLYPPRPRPA